jgi:hypothetical protein
MTPDQIFAEFQKEYPTPLPQRALEAAGEIQSEMVPIFLAQIDEILACDGLLPEDKIQSFFYIFHLLAEWRETQAYRPIIELLRLPKDKLDLLIGEALTSTAWKVVYSVFDGDFAPIVSLIEDETAFAFSRTSMFNTLTAIAINMPVHRPKVLSILGDIFDNFGSGERIEENYAWVGWAIAVCEIGAPEFEDRARKIFDDGGVDDSWMGWNDFEELLKYSTGEEKAPDYWLSEYENPVIESTIDELSRWPCFSKEAMKEAVDAKLLEPFQKREALFAEMGKVGRNDPCSCGSGKKFKKCCLH